MPRRLASIAALLLISAASLLSQTAELTVVSAGPNGELQQLQQADEIRVVFSEPMVPLGRVPSNPAPAWIRIIPAIAGTFRWSGTTILVFTPTAPPPYATTYRVTMDATAESVAGRRLRAPFSFAFTTPTVRMTSVRWARRGGRFDDPVTLAVSFNQPVRSADVLAHLAVRYRPQDFQPPQFTSQERARLAAIDPDGLRQFDVKVADARRNAARTDAVAVRVATGWDRTRFPPASDTLVMLETTTAPPAGTSLEVVIDAQMPSPQGREVPGASQTTVAPLPDAFFATGLNCRTACTPSNYNPIGFTEPVAAARFAAALSATDITDASREQPMAKSAAVRAAARDQSESHSVEDAGFDRQPPARTWVLRLDPSLAAEDGQTLGYPWIGIVENWNDLAFTSFGDGHGVWESSGGPQLPFYSRNFQAVTERVARILPGDLMPRLLELERQRFQVLPPGPGAARRLAVTPNQIQSYGLDLGGAMGTAHTGIYWAGLEPGDPIALAKTVPRDTSTLVQVTNLGISVKDSPQSTLVFVTSLDAGDPVAGAAVSVVNTGNATVWRGHHRIGRHRDRAGVAAPQVRQLGRDVVRRDGGEER